MFWNSWVVQRQLALGRLLLTGVSWIVWKSYVSWIERLWILFIVNWKYSRCLFKTFHLDRLMKWNLHLGHDVLCSNRRSCASRQYMCPVVCRDLTELRPSDLILFGFKSSAYLIIVRRAYSSGKNLVKQAYVVTLSNLQNGIGRHVPV
jgi:hypothetical protein